MVPDQSAPEIAKLHRWAEAFPRLRRRRRPGQAVKRIELVVRLARSEMQQQCSDRVSVRAGKPVKIFSRQILNSSQQNTPHPIKLRDEDADLGTVSSPRSEN